MNIETSFDFELPRRNYRRGICGKMSSANQVRYALRLLELRRLHFRKYNYCHPKLTYRMIARAVGVASPTTINQWDNKDMTAAAILRRLQKKARARKFSDLEERVLCGWAIYKVWNAVWGSILISRISLWRVLLRRNLKNLRLPISGDQWVRVISVLLWSDIT